jgi:hypothetical protein
MKLTDRVADSEIKSFDLHSKILLVFLVEDGEEHIGMHSHLEMELCKETEHFLPLRVVNWILGLRKSSLFLSFGQLLEPELFLKMLFG